MAKLYEMTDEYNELLSWGDDPDIDETAFNDTLEGLTGTIDDKIENIGKVISEYNAAIAGCDTEIKRLQARKKTLENKVTWSKDYIKTNMKKINRLNIVGKLFSFSVRATQEKTIIDDETQIPNEFLKIKTEPDKTAIKEAIKNGQTFEWAHLEKGEALYIK